MFLKFIHIKTCSSDPLIFCHPIGFYCIIPQFFVHSPDKCGCLFFFFHCNQQGYNVHPKQILRTLKREFFLAHIFEMSLMSYGTQMFSALVDIARFVKQ